MKSNKGITLIALIITIIILIILVAVTVTVALEGGLFNNAKDAARETEKHAIYETVVSAIEFDDNQDIDYVLTANKAKIALENDGKTVDDPAIENENIPPRAILTVTGKYGTYQIEINGKEIKFLDDSNPAGGGGDETAVPDELEKYILGPTKEGRSFMEIINPEDFGSLQDPNDQSSTVYQNVIFGSGFDMEEVDSEQGIMYLRIRYLGKVYKVGMDMNTFNTKTLTLVNTTGHIGQYVTYGGIKYIVIGENSNTVTLISANPLQVNNANIKMGSLNQAAITAVPAADESNPTATEKLNRAIWAYNNYINILLEACKSATGLTVDGSTVISIRSIGNANMKYENVNGVETITGTDTDTYTYDYEWAQSDWYTPLGYTMKDIGSNDDEAIMNSLAVFKADNAGSYWLAYRSNEENVDYVRFHVSVINQAYTLYSVCMCQIGKYGSYDQSTMDYDYEAGYISNGVRPIVTLSSSAINW